MTLEEQRIAIAKACGWKQRDNSLLNPHPDLALYWSRPDGGSDFLPDYLNDLDAMHEAEKTLTPTKRGTMACVLTTLGALGVDWGFATAEQRAEAFLRALNLWKD